MARSIAKACLRLTGLFEAELLAELLLRYWNHPRANDPEFRSALLEAGAEVLRASVAGQKLMEDLKPQNMNLVAAVWYAESVSMAQPDDTSASEIELRHKWLNAILKALPSCFCNPDSLL